jgi:hypothetical protein
MTGPYDQHHHRIAAQIQGTHPGWLVMWGTHTRLYWAYPRFGAPPGTVFAEPGTPELITRMHHAELAARAQPPRP